MNLADYIAITIILFLLGCIAWIKCRHWKAEEVSAELVVRAATEAKQYFTMWNELNTQFASLQRQYEIIEDDYQATKLQLTAKEIEVGKWRELAEQWEVARNEERIKSETLVEVRDSLSGQITELHRQLKIKENIIDSQKVSLNRLQGEIKIAKSRNPKTPASSDVRGK